MRIISFGGHELNRKRVFDIMTSFFYRNFLNKSSTSNTGLLSTTKTRLKSDSYFEKYLQKKRSPSSVVAKRQGYDTQAGF